MVNDFKKLLEIFGTRKIYAFNLYVDFAACTELIVMKQLMGRNSTGNSELELSQTNHNTSND